MMMAMRRRGTCKNSVMKTARSEMLSRLLRMTVMDNYVPNEGRKEGREGGREGGKKKKPFRSVAAAVCDSAWNVFMYRWSGSGGAGRGQNNSSELLLRNLALFARSEEGPNIEAKSLDILDCNRIWKTFPDWILDREGERTSAHSHA